MAPRGTLVEGLSEASLETKGFNLHLQGCVDLKGQVGDGNILSEQVKSAPTGNESCAEILWPSS